MITLTGQLAIKTIHGRNGDFNVGRLTTSIGEFVIKNAELDQYAEGKYDGDFLVTEIFPWTYPTGGRMVIEIRARLGGMTLSAADTLSRDEASALSPQEVDPIDEETSVTPATPTTGSVGATHDPLIDTTPFGAKAPAKQNTASTGDADDENLFGALWPLDDVVKLDATVDRRLLRQQRDRLGALGYEFAPLTQDWHRLAA